MLFGFIIKQTVAEAFKIRICNLCLEFLTHTFILLSPCKPAGTVSARTFESFFNCFHNFFIGIKFYSHLLFLPQNRLNCIFKCLLRKYTSLISVNISAGIYNKCKRNGRCTVNIRTNLRIIIINRKTVTVFV